MGAHLYCSSYSQLAGPIDLTSHYYQSALYILHWCKSHKKYLRAPLLRMLAGLTIAVQCSGKFFFAVLGFYVRVEDVGMGNNQKLKHPFSYMYLLSKVKWIYMYIWLNLIWSSWDVDRQLATLKSSWFFKEKGSSGTYKYRLNTQNLKSNLSKFSCKCLLVWKLYKEITLKKQTYLVFI